jgi:hypothetical protein
MSPQKGPPPKGFDNQNKLMYMLFPVGREEVTID